MAATRSIKGQAANPICGLHVTEEGQINGDIYKKHCQCFEREWSDKPGDILVLRQKILCSFKDFPR